MSRTHADVNLSVVAYSDITQGGLRHASRALRSFAVSSDACTYALTRTTIRAGPLSTSVCMRADVFSATGVLRMVKAARGYSMRGWAALGQMYGAGVSASGPPLSAGAAPRRPT